MNNSLLPRLGTFFILIGGGLLIIYIGSILANQTKALYLLFAIAILFLGFLCHRAAPRPTSSRFSTIRKLSQRSRKPREEKLTQEDQKK